MENITGFIVLVEPFGEKPIEFIYNGEKAALKVGDKFIGYFWQMTDKDVAGNFHKAHIRKINLVDTEKRLFRFKGEAKFNVSTVSISIHAKIGPESNNRFLPKEFDQYDTWNLIELT